MTTKILALTDALGNLVRFVLLPLLVTAACFAVFLPSDDALPWTRG